MVFGFGGGGGGGASSSGGGVTMTPQLQAAEAELEMVTDTFNKLVSSCHQKCISTRYLEPDLNKGESVCIDRCVAKFFIVNRMVGEKMSASAGAAAGGGGGGGGGGFF